MSDRPPPVARSLILADYVFRDPLNQKFSILGVFGHVGCSALPAFVGSMWCYLELTEVRGPTRLVVRVVSEDEELTCFSGRTRITAPDPAAVVEAALELRGVEFPRAGTYRLEVLAGKVVIAERPLLVSVASGATATQPRRMAG